MAMHEFITRVNIHDTDAAGIVYFGNIFRLAHTAYEDFLTTTKYSFRMMIDDGRYMLPIVHAHADYKMPMKCGDELTIYVNHGRIGKTSFVLDYEIKSASGELHAVVQTVHVAVDQETFKKTALPDHFKKIFS